MSGNAMRTIKLPTLLALLALCSGCLYRMEVQQGNQLDPTQVEQLTTGMTRTQVLYLLGTPMVPPGFDNDRWDYYHYRDNGRGQGRVASMTQRITVWFKDDKVDRIENSAPPAAPAGEAPAAQAAQGS